MAELSDMDNVALSRMSSLKSPKDVLRTSSSKSVSFSHSELRSDEESAFNYLRPSLADQVRVGYFSMDRACQTEHSEIINLKETTELLRSLVQDVTLLKKNLYYAKLALQADYDAKIEDRSLELHNRTSDRIKEIEKIHEERVKIVRHSFRTQLADAIKRISTEYHRFYANKGEQQDSKHQEEMDRIAKEQEEERNEKLAQQEMIEMMQLQMSNEDQEEEIIEVPKSPSVSSEMERHADEIRNLTDIISNLEDRIEEYEDILDSKNEENMKLAKELEEHQNDIIEERNRSAKLNREMMEIKLALEIEKKNGKEQLEKQKEDMKQLMDDKIEKAKEEASAAASKKMSDLEDATRLNESRIKEEMKMKESQLLEKNKKLQQNFNDSDYIRLKEMQKQLRLEIVRLQKELEKSNKTWELKVTILQQTMHALKDEMYIRTSLQRQSAKLQHAAITYANNGPAPISAGVAPSKPPSSSRKYQLPSLIQGPRSSSELAGMGSGDNSNDESRRSRNDDAKPRAGASSGLSLTRTQTSSSQPVT